MNDPQTEPSKPRDRGAAMVEFALISIPLLFLLFGIIESGRAYNAQISLQGAVREGARALALKETSVQVNTAVINAAPAVEVLATDITQRACPNSQNYAQVTARATLDFVLPPMSFFDNAVLSATAEMRCGL